MFNIVTYENQNWPSAEYTIKMNAQAGSAIILVTEPITEDEAPMFVGKTLTHLGVDYKIVKVTPGGYYGATNPAAYIQVDQQVSQTSGEKIYIPLYDIDVAGQRLSTNSHYTGEHMGTPMQDALNTEANADAHYVEANTVRYSTMMQDSADTSFPKATFVKE